MGRFKARRKGKFLCVGVRFKRLSFGGASAPRDIKATWCHQRARALFYVELWCFNGNDICNKWKALLGDWSCGSDILLSFRWKGVVYCVLL